MPTDPGKPLPIEKVMAPGALRDTPSQLLPMRVRNPHSIVPTTAQTPNHTPPHVKPPVPPHPRQQTRPQPVRRLRVPTVRRTVRRAGNLHHDGRPPPLQKLVAPHRVIRPVPVQPRHQHHHGPLVRSPLLLRARRNPDIDRQPPKLGRHHALLQRSRPQLPGQRVRRLLRLPRPPFDRVVDGREGRDVGEAGDAVDRAGAQVQGRRGGLVGGGVGLGGEALGGGEEGRRVGRGGGVVDVVLFGEWVGYCWKAGLWVERKGVGWLPG